MRELPISENTFRELVKLKNHWSLHHREVTNPEVIKAIEQLKGEIFGYDDSTPAKEIERISNKKSRDQLEAEMDRFSMALNELLLSGFDFEPNYTFEDHIKQMMESFED